jgi:hypothetical protein
MQIATALQKQKTNTNTNSTLVSIMVATVAIKPESLQSPPSVQTPC